MRRAFVFQEPDMADYRSHFSCVLDVGTPQNALRALELYRTVSADGASDEPLSDGFLLSVTTGDGRTQLWIRDDGHGDPERVIEFVKICAAAFNLSGHWGFQYADTCSQPRLDGFGGGAHMLDLATGETVASTSTNDWLTSVLSGGDGDA